MVQYRQKNSCGFVETIACAASVSNRVITRALEREQKKKGGRRRGRGEEERRGEEEKRIAVAFAR